jgi:hypothetical protein
MSDRQFERAVHDWLEDGSDRTPPTAIQGVLFAVKTTPQQRDLRIPRRFIQMPNYLRYAPAAAIVAIVGVGALAFLHRGPNLGGPPTPAPTIQPSPTATTSPTAAAVPLIVDGPLAALTYRLRPFASGTMTIDATVPDGGWRGGVPNAISGPRGESNGPNGVVVAFLRAQTINSDPCHWDHDGNGSPPDDGDIVVGPTVDDLAEALAGSSAYESTTPVDATIGGFAGKQLELQLTPDPSGCDSYGGAGDQYFVFGGRDGWFFAQGGANTWQVTIVDVEGTRLIAVLIAYEETTAADLSAAKDILASLVITP